MFPFRSCAGITVVVAVCIGLLFALHPKTRVCNLFEFMTDGWAPDYIANSAQLGLYKVWERSYANGAFDPKGNIAAAVADLAGDHGVVLEMAAGDGGISTMLLNTIREKGGKGLNTTVVLTDFQPHVAAWERVQKKYPKGMVEFVAASVDATDVAGSLAKAAALPVAQSARVRMINFALHHFEAPLVQNIFADVVATGGALVVGDLKPTAGSVFNNHLLCHWVTLEVAQDIWPPPMYLLPFAPLAPVLSTWDATISSLRAYSAEELAAIAARVPGGGPNAYAWHALEMGSYADFLGVPAWLRPMLPGIDAAVGQFFLFYPKNLSLAFEK